MAPLSIAAYTSSPAPGSRVSGFGAPAGWWGCSPPGMPAVAGGGSTSPPQTLGSRNSSRQRRQACIAAPGAHALGLGPERAANPPKRKPATPPFDPGKPGAPTLTTRSTSALGFDRQNQQFSTGLPTPAPGPVLAASIVSWRPMRSARRVRVHEEGGLHEGAGARSRQAAVSARRPCRAAHHATFSARPARSPGASTRHPGPGTLLGAANPSFHGKQRTTSQHPGAHPSP